MRVFSVVLTILGACSTAAPLGDPPTILPPLPADPVAARQAAHAAAAVPRVAPPPHAAPLRPAPAPAPHQTYETAAHAVAVDFLAEVFAEPRMSARIIGWVQTGRSLDLGPRVPTENHQCRQGWYPLADGRGFVCAGRGVMVGQSERPTRRGTAIANLDEVVPYRYAFVHVEPGTPRYRRRPTPEERAAREALGATAVDGDLVGGYMQRGFMVSVRGLAGLAPNSFWSCVRGGYVRYEHAYTLRPRPFQGVDLGATGARLPLAFLTAYGPSQWRATGDELRPAGDARRLIHFDASQPAVVGGTPVLSAPDGALYRAEDVSVARVPPLPADLTAGERWIHVSLRDQTLVAMQGDRPVYATVVSTGLPTAGRRTRPGTYHVQAKHVSATMDDDAAGSEYSIEDVPWTMFYDHSFALHGAFWHERFGHPQSHGCVNLSAADAKWLFAWAGPALPAGWYGMLATERDPGARIVIED